MTLRLKPAFLPFPVVLYFNMFPTVLYSLAALCTEPMCSASSPLSISAEYLLTREKSH